jgi:N,N'-diacetyllegionaminate synthase
MYIIGEIGQAHDGSLGIAHSYIDALSKAGVDAVKFQIHIANAESSAYEEFRIPFSYEDKTRFEYWKRMEFSEEQWLGLKKHTEELGMDFIASPFSICAVNLLERIGNRIYKIASGEVLNKLMIDKIANLNPKIILSTGMSSYDEIQKAVNWIKVAGCDDLSILQCTTSYPCMPEYWGLNVIPELKERFNLPIGYSDHSGEIFSAIGAFLHGAELLEVHAVFDKQMFGPDSTSSLTIAEIKELIRAVSKLKIAVENKVQKNEINTDVKRTFGKSLAINKDLKKGSLITLQDLESKKPSGMGIPADEYERILGKTLSKSLSKWEFLNYNNIE